MGIWLLRRCWGLLIHRNLLANGKQLETQLVITKADLSIGSRRSATHLQEHVGALPTQVLTCLKGRKLQQKEYLTLQSRAIYSFHLWNLQDHYYWTFCAFGSWTNVRIHSCWGRAPSVHLFISDLPNLSRYVTMCA
jgi:hypothetical protein